MTWIEVEGFPNYVVNEEGIVKNIETDQVRRPSMTGQGAMKITLFRDGEPHTRSLALIVAKAHLYNDHDPDIFDTPIHLDNDLSNNHVENLKWRPRWFAVKYQQQYWNEEYRNSRVRVLDINTGDVYDSIMQPCQRYGLLFVDVLKSCTRGDTVFPTWKKFEFVG